ncbi:hypothetical protein N399_03055 [Bacillus licheniformis CG-B52]|nr:hypothetical protein N399_03055 [Bacillus licheniformis CG-B52]KUL06610.1 hypothetical protein LI17339_21120 [Bacillus licheniformis LMG 17339]
MKHLKFAGGNFPIAKISACIFVCIGGVLDILKEDLE